MPKITFTADKVFVKRMRSDNSFRVELDTGEYSLPQMQELMGAPEGVYRITIEPEISEA